MWRIFNNTGTRPPSKLLSAPYALSTLDFPSTCGHPAHRAAVLRSAGRNLTATKTRTRTVTKVLDQGDSARLEPRQDHLAAGSNLPGRHRHVRHSGSASTPSTCLRPTICLSQMPATTMVITTITQPGKIPPTIPTPHCRFRLLTCLSRPQHPCRRHPPPSPYQTPWLNSPPRPSYPPRDPARPNSPPRPYYPPRDPPRPNRPPLPSSPPRPTHRHHLQPPLPLPSTPRSLLSRPPPRPSPLPFSRLFPHLCRPPCQPASYHFVQQPQ